MADDAPGETTDADATAEPDERDVVVPLRVYKTVTVFSTLIAVVCVVGGFVLIDRATDRATAPAAEIDAAVALAGVGLIVFGAASYAFATRFRTADMGSAGK